MIRRSLLAGILGVPLMSYGEKGSGYNNSPIPIFEAGNTFVVNATGQFIYNGTPAAGNLVESNIIPQVPTSDGNGNLALPGVTSYFLISGSTYVAISMFKGELIFSTSTTGEGGPWVTESTLIQNLANQLTLNCPQQLSLSSGLGASLGITNILFTVTDLVVGNGKIVAATDPNAGGEEAYHTPVKASFVDIANNQVVRYRLLADGDIEITGAMAAGGAGYTAGSAIWTMPAGYIPVTNNASVATTRDVANVYTTIPCNIIAGTGVVSIPININANDFIIFSGGRYRLNA